MGGETTSFVYLNIRTYIFTTVVDAKKLSTKTRIVPPLPLTEIYAKNAIFFTVPLSLKRKSRDIFELGSVIVILGVLGLGGRVQIFLQASKTPKKTSIIAIRRSKTRVLLKHISCFGKL